MFTTSPMIFVYIWTYSPTHISLREPFPRSGRVSEKRLLALQENARWTFWLMIRHLPAQALMSNNHPLSTHQTVYYDSFPFPNKTFRANLSRRIGVKGVPPIPHTVTSFLALLKDLIQTSTRVLELYRLKIHIQNTILTTFCRVVSYQLYSILKARQETTLRESWCVNNTKGKVEGRCAPLKCFTTKNRLRYWPP